MLLKCADGRLPAAGLVCEKKPPLQMFLQMSHPATSCSPERRFTDSAAQREPAAARVHVPQMNEVKEGKWMFQDPGPDSLGLLLFLLPVYILFMWVTEALATHSFC